MSGTRGTLYFIGEWDVFTGEQSPYTKIGIVKDDRDVKSREKDHRTGNPRKLESIKDIQAPYVQTLETYLHNTLAKFRVGSGEWFQLDNQQLQEQMKLAEELAMELSNSEAALDAAEVLSDLENRTGTIEPTKDLLDKHYRLVSVQEELKVLKKQEKEVKDALVDGFSGKEEWSHLFKTGDRKESVTFDGTAFKKAHPDVHAKFVFPKKSWAYEIVSTDAPLESMNLVELDLDAISADPIQLHQKFLEIWSAKAQLSWQESLIEAALISACAENLAIEGVLAWEEKTRNTFDKTAMLEEHPEFESEFQKTTEAKTTYSPAEWASYKI